MKGTRIPILAALAWVICLGGCSKTPEVAQDSTAVVPPAPLASAAPSVFAIHVVENSSLTPMLLESLDRHPKIELEFKMTPTGPSIKWYAKGDSVPLAGDMILFAFESGGDIQVTFRKGSEADAEFDSLLWMRYPALTSSDPYAHWTIEILPEGGKPKKKFVIKDKNAIPGDWVFGIQIRYRGNLYLADPTIVEDPDKPFPVDTLNVLRP